MKYKSLKDKRAFTIFELLIVMAVLGILVLVATQSLIGFVGDAKMTDDLNTASQAVKSIEKYKAKHGWFAKDTMYIGDFDRNILLNAASDGSVVTREGVVAASEITDVTFKQLDIEEVDRKMNTKGLIVVGQESGSVYLISKYEHEVPVIMGTQYALTINYLYSDDSVAFPAYTGQFMENSNYSIPSPAAPGGYTVDMATVTGNIGTADREVTVRYGVISSTYNLGITYRNTSGTEVAATYEVTLDSGETYSVNSPVITGYTASQTVVSGTISSDTLVNVVYTPINYSITYNLDGGTNHINNPSSYSIINTPLTLQDASKSGYSFSGWFTAAVGGSEVVTITSSDLTNKTLYARWVAGQADYEVRHYKENLSGTYVLDSTDNLTGTVGTTATATPKVYTGYTQNTSHPDRMASGTIANDGSLILKLYYSLNSYNVTFTNHDNSVIKTESVKHGENATPPANPTRTGYTFTSWDGTYTNITSSRTLQAQFNIVTYTITYNLDGGTNNAGNPPTYTVEDTTFTLLNPTKAGYSFVGWFDASTGGNQITSVTSAQLGNKTLYARWMVKQIATLTKTYTFDTGNEGFSLNTITWNGADDALQIAATGRNTKFDGSASITASYESIGVPAGATITGIQLSIDGRSNQYFTVDISTWSATLNGTSAIGSINYSGITSWSTSSSTQRTVSSNPSESFTIAINTSLDNGNHKDAISSIQFDNVSLIVTYEY